MDDQTKKLVIVGAAGFGLGLILTAVKYNFFDKASEEKSPKY